MQLVDLNKPGEKKKLLVAAALGLGAIIVLWWALFGFGDSNSRPTRTSASAPTPRNPPTTSRPQQQAPVAEVQNLANFAPVDYLPSSYSAPEPKRNIFAFYEPP